jgi:hypothetical protein
VVNSDDETYLRMSYVSSWLEEALAGHPDSTLFMSRRQLVDLWENLARGTQHESVKIPLDQSHFDWQQNKRMIRRFLDVVRHFISVNADNRVRQDLLFVVDNLYVTLVEEPGILTVGTGNEKTTLEISKGIMSGWRWTALMDTVFNWGELFAAQQLLKDYGVAGSVISAVAQGDDDQVTCSSYGYAAALAEAYKMMNFEVNPGKFFIRTKTDEFLRQVATQDNVSGYLVRTVNSILWRNPVSRDPPAGLLRMTEQLKIWNLAIGRGGDRSQIERLMRIDLAQGNGLSNDNLEGILRTPNVFGGLGWEEREFYSNENWLSFKPGSTIQKGQIDVSTVHGLTSELEEWKELGAEMDLSYAVNELRDNLELSKAGKILKPGEFTTEGKESPFRTRATMMSAGPPLMGRMRRDAPPTLGTAALRQAIRLKKWQWIRDVWLDPDLVFDSDRIQSRGGRRVWVDWLLGKLPWRTPTIKGWADLKPSIVYSDYCRGYWAKVMRFNSFTYRSVKRAALSAELDTRYFINRQLIRLGG